MELQGVTPILNVSSMQESVAWFARLGFRKLWDWGDPPTFGAVGNGKVEIFLCLGRQGGRSRSTPPSPWEDDTGGTWMSWWVGSPAEVDTVYRLALEQGITVTWPPTDMPWCVRECHLRHPDGHTFRVGAGTEEE